MSIKVSEKTKIDLEKIKALYEEYLKIKLREREFHVDCIFKAYSFIQKSEYSREMFIGSNRKERIYYVVQRKNERRFLRRP